MYFEDLPDQLSLLAKKGANILTLGKSVLGREIFALEIGAGDKTLFLEAGMHGREHGTADVLIKLLHDLLLSASFDAEIARIIRKNRIVAVPLSNPDGAELSKTFERWKANANGVDLNRNFDAFWKDIDSLPSGEAFCKGPAPFSEPETKALKSIAASADILATFHAAGGEIYWWSFDAENRHSIIADELKSLCGYRLVKPSEHLALGGLRDWFVLTSGKPGFTFEIGTSAPLSKREINENADILNGVLPFLLRNL